MSKVCSRPWNVRHAFEGMGGGPLVFHLHTSDNLSGIHTCGVPKSQPCTWGSRNSLGLHDVNNTKTYTWCCTINVTCMPCKACLGTALIFFSDFDLCFLRHWFKRKQQRTEANSEWEDLCMVIKCKHLTAERQCQFAAITKYKLWKLGHKNLTGYKRPALPH